MHKFALTFAALGFALTAAAVEPNEKEFQTGSNQHQSENTDKLINIKHGAFKPGEKLTYRLTYGAFDAGEATLSVVETKKTIKGRPLWRMVGTGKTVSAFEWFYKVDDLYESYMDVDAMVPWVFKRRVDEGGFKISQDYTFFQHKNTVETEKGATHNVPDKVQDMISAFYYARTFDFSKAKVGEEFMVNIFLDDELFPTKIKYMGLETIRTRKGKYKCHVFAPVVIEGRVFENEDAMRVWITADGNKIPIMAKAKIKVGTIKMHLVGWQGLANPMVEVK